MLPAVRRFLESDWWLDAGWKETDMYVRDNFTEEEARQFRAGLAAMRAGGEFARRVDAWLCRRRGAERSARADFLARAKRELTLISG